MDAISSIEFDLTLVYREILDRMDPRGLKLLHWVLYAVRELTVEELRFAVGIEPGMKDLDCDVDLPPSQSFLDCTLGLLTVVQQSENRHVVHFSHLTIKDYLSDHSSEYFPDGHATLAHITITYLNFTALSSETGRARFAEQGDLYPFFEYAALEWGRHANLADDDAEICNIALEWLLSEKFSHFLEIRLSRFKRLYRWLCWVHSPLHETCFFGLTSITTKLLQSGQNVNILDSERRTPLHDADVPDGQTQHTTLHLAAYFGQAQSTRALLQHQSLPINSCEGHGSAPLHLAVWMGHEATVNLLLDHADIDVNVLDQNQDTPLHIAAYRGQTRIARALLRHQSVQVNLPDYMGWTPLHLAVWVGDEDIVDLLLHHPDVDVNVSNENQETPLHIAAYLGHTLIARALLHFPNINVNYRDEKDRTPLTYAVRRRKIDIARMLLARKDTDIYPASYTFAERRPGQLPDDLLLKLGVLPSFDSLLSDLEIALFSESLY
jgi:ankyrin repeat protein